MRNPPPLQKIVQGLIDVERESPGRYLVTIEGKLPTDGVLLIQAAGWTPDGRNTMPAFMSYQPKADAVCGPL